MTKKRMKTPGKARHPTAMAGEMKGPVLNTGYSHGGASLTRQALRGYNPVKSSSKSDVDANLNVLRNRSADMYINSPLGASAINTSPCCLFCYVSVSSYSLKVKWLNNDYFLDKSNVIVMNIYHSSTCLL